MVLHCATLCCMVLHCATLCYIVLHCATWCYLQIRHAFLVAKQNWIVVAGLHHRCLRLWGSYLLGSFWKPGWGFYQCEEQCNPTAATGSGTCRRCASGDGVWVLYPYMLCPGILQVRLWTDDSFFYVRNLVDKETRNSNWMLILKVPRDQQLFIPYELFQAGRRNLLIF